MNDFGLFEMEEFLKKKIGDNNFSSMMELFDSYNLVLSKKLSEFEYLKKCFFTFKKFENVYLKNEIVGSFHFYGAGMMFSVRCHIFFEIRFQNKKHEIINIVFDGESEKRISEDKKKLICDAFNIYQIMKKYSILPFNFENIELNQYRINHYRENYLEKIEKINEYIQFNLDVITPKKKATPGTKTYGTKTYGFCGMLYINRLKEKIKYIKKSVSPWNECILLSEVSSLLKYEREYNLLKLIVKISNIN